VVLVATAAVVVALGGWTYWRMSADPDLGPGPQGPAHGSTDTDLAVYAVTQLLGLLSPIGTSHATVTLSEQDLTAVARQNASDRFANPVARVRDGQVVVSGNASVAGFGVTAVGRLSLRVATGADGNPDVAASIDEIDAGRLTLPGFLRDAIAQQVQSRVQLGGILQADPRLRGLRPALECVKVVPTGVVLGFHRPGASADPATCGG
jgi:hypothetical protein